MNRICFVRCMLAIIIALTISLANVTPNQAMIINRKLNGELPNSGDVWRTYISPDGKYVVYCATQTDDFIYDIFSVPIAGGESVQLNPTLPEGSRVSCDDSKNIQISGDSQRVVYIADQEVDNKFEFFISFISSDTFLPQISNPETR